MSLYDARNADSPCAGRASGASNIVLTGEASDKGAYWFEADDPAALTRIALTADPELSRAITFRAQNLTTPAGELELHGGVGRTETSDALTFERLQWADGYREDSTAIGVGAVQRLFDGRLTVSTDLSWSTSASLWRDVSEPGSLEILSRQGAARWHKLEAKVIDTPEFQWSVSGETSVVERGYSGNAAARPAGKIGLAGDASKWATKLSAFGATALASVEHFAGVILSRDVQRVALEIDGVSATLYDKELQRRSFIDPAQLVNRKAIEGLSLEVTPALLVPEIAAESAAVPELITVTLERGTIAYPTTSPGDDTTNIEALVMWKTMLGDTTALYSYEQTGHDLAGFGFAGELDQLIDVSHAIKFGEWRVSVGANLLALEDTVPTDSFADTAISGTFAVRYAPARGPKLEASLGRTHDEFSLDELDLNQRSRATTLAMTLDLSDFVQDQLDRRDTFFKLQYRHQLHQSEFSIDESLPEQSERNADALLMSLRTPLN